MFLYRQPLALAGMSQSTCAGVAPGTPRWRGSGQRSGMGFGQAVVITSICSPEVRHFLAYTSSQEICFFLPQFLRRVQSAAGPEHGRRWYIWGLRSIGLVKCRSGIAAALDSALQQGQGLYKAEWAPQKLILSELHSSTWTVSNLSVHFEDHTNINCGMGRHTSLSPKSKI